MRKLDYHGRVMVIGFGGVAQCTLPLLLKNLGIPAQHYTVVDFVGFDPERTAPYEQQGVRFEKLRITQQNLQSELERHLQAGDLLVDLAWNIDCIELLEWCRTRGVMYINTSVELWDPYKGAETLTPPERTLYVRHRALTKMIERWGDNNGTTALLDHGANPGLVSHFAKRALRDITHRLLAENPRDPRRAALERALEGRHYNHLAKELGVRVIHISERDTQHSRRVRKPHEFMNTWSVEGFYEEGIAPAEMGWGTHERTLPEGAWEHREGPRNQICLERRGMDTFVRTRVPSAEIAGMVIRHGEAYSLSHYLQVDDDRGQAVYRPTVHYAYLPCPQAVTCLQEVRERNYKGPHSYHIMSNDIEGGADELGVLLMGHDYKSWWCGTVLSIDRARQLLPGQNATTLQVAASVLGAVSWMIRNPRSGVRLPDELPDDEILAVAEFYLGNVPSLPLDWVPTVPGEVTGHPREDATWQFDRFLIGADERDPSGDRITGARLLREHTDLRDYCQRASSRG